MRWGSTIFGTYNTTFYPDRYADWRIEDLTVTLKNKMNGSTWRNSFGSYDVQISLYDCRFILYKNCQLYAFKHDTYCIKSSRMQKTTDRKTSNLDTFHAVSPTSFSRYSLVFLRKKTWRTKTLIARDSTKIQYAASRNVFRTLLKV